MTILDIPIDREEGKIRAVARLNDADSSIN